MHPYEIFPARTIAHLAVDEHMRQISYTPEEIQTKTDEILNRQGTSFGHRVAYVHIPFCEKLCKYCSFYRIKKDESLLAKFLDDLIASLHWFAEHPYVASVPFEAIYLGGGTPTTMTVSQIQRLTRAINACLPLSPNVEFTCESSFANLNDEKLQALCDGGVNRMSLGVQTFSGRLRKLIGRACQPEDVLEKIAKVRNYMDVVNLDLIYNFPTQTLSEWEANLQIAAETGVDGICAHSLIPVEDSPLSKMIVQGAIEPMGDTKKQYDFYSMAQSMLPAKGYHQINFTHFTNGPQERIVYLRLRLEEGDCFPFGAGAVGNFGDLVIINHSDLGQYGTMVKSQKVPAEVAAPLPEQITFLWALAGQIQQMGVEKEHFKAKYQIDLDDKYNDLLVDLEAKGLIKNYSDHFTLTRLGLFWGYNICAAFFRNF